MQILSAVVQAKPASFGRLALNLLVISFATNLLTGLLGSPWWLARDLSPGSLLGLAVGFILLSPFWYLFSMTLGFSHVVKGPETFVSHDAVPYYIVPREAVIALLAVLLVSLLGYRHVWGRRLAYLAAAAFTSAVTINAAALFECCS